MDFKVCGAKQIHSRILALNCCFWPDHKKTGFAFVFEELVLPEAISLTQNMIDEKAGDTLKTVPLSPTKTKERKKKHVSC